MIKHNGVSHGLQDRPLVGLLAQEYWHTGSVNQSYIAVSYVKYLESAGARVVPVMINETDEYYKQIIAKTNGLLIPGGGQDLHTSGFAQAGAQLLKYAHANATRSYPIWTTCLGFELVSLLMSKIPEMGACDTNDVALTLNMTADFKASRMFAGADPALIEILQKEPVTYNHHIKCLTIDQYNSSPELNSEFKILSTNTDPKGVKFVSTWESLSPERPIYGVQWHPEKNSYEFDAHKHIPHTANAILVGQYLADFFVNECRKVWTPAISQKDEMDMLIYNYQPRYMASKTGKPYTYEQIYFENIL
ncbi:unnamed protein product [Medioppia subpectinata]|uniref:folate gamma-glutamyl hydrolase n=1 Tax=Medioppia subpectinata TaxID=1979941 RepID=A0A7R9PTQ2_9ACAR|nr:unnamed protein product [Medioppia subpectinata]CAG2100772.1 unnamed protein product [Medioppia subpectinata]